MLLLPDAVDAAVGDPALRRFAAPAEPTDSVFAPPSDDGSSSLGSSSQQEEGWRDAGGGVGGGAGLLGRLRWLPAGCIGSHTAGRRMRWPMIILGNRTRPAGGVARECGRPCSPAP